MNDLELAMRAKSGLIWIVTEEEDRVKRLVIEQCCRIDPPYKMNFWTFSKGVHDANGETQSNTQDPSDAIRHILEIKERSAFVLMDLSPLLKDPLTCRMLKDLAQDQPRRSRTEALQIIIIDCDEPPSSVSATVIYWSLPDRNEVGTILDGLLQYAPEEATKEVNDNGTRETIIDASIGLTADQIGVALAKSLVITKRFDGEIVSKEKQQAVRGSGLEWYDPLLGGLDSVGGLDNLKQWLGLRQAGFTKKGKDYGLPSPRGLLLCGIAGCGKSLTAKAVSTSWKVPLLRLDMGALFSKWLGESEGKVRTALKRAEAVAPCVLWLDEIEKALASGGGDNSTTLRVLATVLTWMQEKSEPVFIIATANDVSALPPELLRAGRWDDIFFVDLPTRNERAEIVEVLKGKYQNCDKVNAKQVAKMSGGYTGAELEAGITAALYAAFAENKKVGTPHVMAELKEIVPLSESQAERVEALRNWAKGRARSASIKPKNDEQSGGILRQIEMEN